MMFTHLQDNKRSLLGRLRNSSASVRSNAISDVESSTEESVAATVDSDDTNYEGFEEETEGTVDTNRSGPLNAINGYRLRPASTKILSTEEIKIREKKDAGMHLLTQPLSESLIAPFGSPSNGKTARNSITKEERESTA